jgi:hypothetical protein
MSNFGSAAALGVAAWGAGAVTVRALRPFHLLQEEAVGATGLRLALTVADAIVDNGKAVARDCTMEPVAVALAAALVCDGLVRRFCPELFITDASQLAASAQTMILAAGLGLLVVFAR